ASRRSAGAREGAPLQTQVSALGRVRRRAAQKRSRQGRSQGTHRPAKGRRESVAMSPYQFRAAWMTSEELAEALAGPIPVAVMIPVGAIEPHGPHLPLDTDVIISRSASERAVERLSAAGVRGLTAPEV